MNYDNNNIFAKILREELPCIKVYEDDNTIAFMDIMPQADGHVLVIPKEPAETLLDLSDTGCATLLPVVKKLATAVKQGMQADGVSLFQLNGSAAGQTVPHIHFHIIPGSILAARSHASALADQAHLAELAEKIKAAL